MTLAMMTDDPTTCGNRLHPSDCLCDVVLDGPPTPVNHNPATSSRLGEMVARVIDPSDDPLRYLQALVEAKDATARIATATKSTGVVKGLREQAIELLTQGNSMLDLPSMLSATAGDILVALTSGSFSPLWGWTDFDWLAAEAALQDSAHHGRGSRFFSTRWGVPRNSVEAIFSWYGSQAPQAWRPPSGFPVAR